MTRKRELILRMALVIASLLVAFIVGEWIFRAALFSETLAVPKLQQAWRFADSSYEDSFWKLSFLFGAGGSAQRVGHIHPELGWAPETTPENPLGIISEEPYAAHDLGRAVLFFGDSFVAGASPIPDRIPQVLDRLAPERRVLNYGVGGYGVDQIYLRFSKTLSRFEDPVALVGILTHDLDRSVLSIRTGQKPYFEVVDGDLVLRNLPILASTRQYVEQYPPEISSYLLRFALFRLRDVIPERWFNSLFGYEEKHQEKLLVNRMILERLTEEARSRGIAIYGVLFFSEEELRSTGWREQFLRSTFEELEIPFFDTKRHLLEYAAANDLDPGALYYDDNGHPNVRGNAVIADGLYAWLRSKGVFESAQRKIARDGNA